MKYFETRFMEEANEFISELDPKTVKKIFYNITLLNRLMTQNYSRNYRMKFGNFAQNLLDFKSDYLHFGISQTTRKPW